MRIALVLAALLALAGCQRGGGEAGDEPVLRVGSQKGGTKSMLLASGALAGAKYRVEWSEFPAAQHLLEAIGSGAVDVGVTGDAPFLFAYQSGSPVKAVAAEAVERMRPGALSIIVPKASPIHGIADLKGKKIATTRGSVGHFLMLKALERAKLPVDAVTLVYLAPGDAKAAFSSGAIDAWAIWTPFTALAMKDGARIVVDGTGLVKNYGFDVANEQAIATRREIMADFLRREAKAYIWVGQHPDAFADVFSKETGLPRDVALHYALENHRLAVPLTPALIAEQRDVVEVFGRVGGVKMTRDLGAAFEPLVK